MARRKTLRRKATPFPDVPVQRGTNGRNISEDEWLLIGFDIQAFITASYSARQTLEENLRIYNRIYELYSEPINEPFKDSSNLALPVAVSKLDSLFAQVAAKVFVPDVFVITGNTAEGDAVAWDIQRWYNNDFRKQRDNGLTRIGESLKMLHYGLLEGTSVLAVGWKKIEDEEVYVVQTPKTDEDGGPSFNDDGEVDFDDQEVYQTITTDEAGWRTLQLKDFMLVPDESVTIESAAAVAECYWLMESDMREMIDAKLLELEWVEKILAYNPNGQSDVAADRQGYWDKTAGGQLDLGQGQGSAVSSQFQNRGPFKIWKYTSDQFDMNGDGVCERNNVFWWHEQSNWLIGWTPSRTISRKRGYFAFTPLPRKNSFYGFSLLERLAPINAEINTIHNNRNNAASLRLRTPMLGNLNLETHRKKFRWDLGEVWWVEDLENAFKMFEIPDVPISGYQEESQLNAYADQLAGQSAPQAGGQTAGRKSATEVKISAAGSGTRSDLIALYFRYTLRDAFQYTHQLNIQNMPETPTQGKFQPDKAALSQDLNLDVAGTSDPIDMQTYGQEVLSFYQLMSQDHDIQSDAEHRYFLKRTVANILHIGNVEAILGTADEAKQKKQEEAQAAQMQQQMGMQQAQAKQTKEEKDTPIGMFHEQKQMQQEQQQDQQQQQQQAQQQAQQQQQQPPGPQ